MTSIHKAPKLKLIKPLCIIALYLEVYFY